MWPADRAARRQLASLAQSRIGEAVDSRGDHDRTSNDFGFGSLTRLLPPEAVDRQASPDDPSPSLRFTRITGLPSHYETARRCAPHHYSPARGFSRLGSRLHERPRASTAPNPPRGPAQQNSEASPDLAPPAWPARINDLDEDQTGGDDWRTFRFPNLAHFSVPVDTFYIQPRYNVRARTPGRDAAAARPS
jgi:hypothetical protein